MAQTIKTGDTVKVIAGDLKGQTAKVVKVVPAEHKAMLEGLGIRTRHYRATQFNPKGGKKDIHSGIDLSNLVLVESAKFEKKSKKEAK